MGVSAPPRRRTATVIAEQEHEVKPHPANERKAEEIINRGGSTASSQSIAKPEQVKNFNIKIGSGTLSMIDELRAYRPRRIQSPKLGISLHDWILEAIEEKTQREKRKYKIGV